MSRALSKSKGAALLLAVVATASAWTSPARAEDATAVCIEASEKSIPLRREGKLHDALKMLAACADPSCPDEVKDECKKRIAKIDETMPTLILVAKSATGEDVAGVSVSVDGFPLPAGVDGRPLALDPGPHRVVMTVGTQPPVERSLVLREGEKNRQEVWTLGPARTEPPPPKPPPPAGWGGQKIAGVVVAGVGVVGLGLGATFGLLASSAKSDEDKACSKATCPNPSGASSAYDRATTDATVSTVSFIAGGALLAGGAVLFFTGRSGDAKTGALRLAPLVSERQRGLVLGGEF